MSGEVAPRESGDERLPARELRASHEDRDRAVELLRLAAGDGRLSADELDQRLEVALTARTYGELAALTRDLPAAPGLTAAAEPKDLIRIEARSGSARRDGRWVVPKRMEIRVSSGSVRLDFTGAVITQATLQIDAEVSSGSLILITRPGIVVDTDDVSVGSGSVCQDPATRGPSGRHPAEHPGVGKGRQRQRHGGAAPAAEAATPHLLAVAAAPPSLSGSRGCARRPPPVAAAAGWRAG